MTYGDVSITELSSDTFIEYKATLRTQGKTVATIVRYLMPWLGFIKWCRKMGLIEKEIFIEIPRYTTKERQAIPETMMKRFIWEEPNLCHRVIFALLYITAARVSELANIKLDDINFEANTISILGKGGKYRLLTYDDNTGSLIREYLNTRKYNSEWLLVGYHNCHTCPDHIERIVRQRAAALGLKEVTPHTLRHTSLTHFYRKFKDIRLCKDKAGHSKIATTDRYIHTTLDDVREATQALSATIVETITVGNNQVTIRSSDAKFVEYCHRFLEGWGIDKT